MKFEYENIGLDCLSHEIASYIDGELDAAREAEIEAHFSICEFCSEELNQQKQFLATLTSSLRNEKEVDLPAGFTRSIVANAESTVSGLRRPRERFNAIFICAGLFLFALFALGTGAGNLVGGISNIFSQLAAVGGFFGRIVYSVFLGVGMILRSLAAQFRFDLVIAVALTAIFVVLLMFVSRRVLRINRA